MARPGQQDREPRFEKSPGIDTFALDLGDRANGSGKAKPKQRQAAAAPARPFSSGTLAITADGNIAALADGPDLLLIPLDFGDGGKRTSPARVRLPGDIRLLAAMSGGQGIAAALADRSIVVVDPCAAPTKKRSKEHEVCRKLVADLGGDPRALIRVRSGLVAMVVEPAGGRSLVFIDPSCPDRPRRAALPFRNVTGVSAIDPDANDTLLVMDSRHGAQLVAFTDESDADAIDVAPIGAEMRATAVTALDSEWLAVARKGGEIVVQRALGSNGPSQRRLAEQCRILRQALERCGCACHRDPRPGKPSCDCCDECGGRPPKGTDPSTGHPPDGGRPGEDPGGHSGPGGGPGTDGGWPADDEPCGDRKRALLNWSVTRLARSGRHLLAFGDSGRRMAVLDRDLNVLAERYLGTRGALVAAGGPSGDSLIMLARPTPGQVRVELERWSLGEYLKSRTGTDAPEPPRRKVDPAFAKPIVFRGLKTAPATPNPHLRVCVFTVVEPGQVFGDPDQAKMQAQLVPNVYNVCEAYYRENSYQTLTPEFAVFGVHIGGPRTPLVLPHAFAHYFFDAYAAGGLEATMPANWAVPPMFDGTEAMTIHTEPHAGVGKDYAVPFAALWTTRTHNAYPVQVNFAGTETFQLQIVDKAGTAQNLNVTVPALALTHVQGDDEATFLTALKTHITNAIRAAENSAATPGLLQDVTFRRIRLNDDDTQFGRLQAQLRLSGAGGQKGRITLVPPAAVPAALTAIGFGGIGSRSGVVTSRQQIVNYVGECLNAAQFDAGDGQGLNDPQFNATLETEENVAAQTVRARINLSSEKGGAGAQISLVSSSELGALGWSTATPVPGSESTANDSNTMRYHQDLADDIFTAAMNHLRSIGAWNRDAVQAQFDGFDGMMIGFVGACPLTVPPADRWNAADSVDFGRLRMFVRGHQATDRTPPAGEAPVTMSTGLLIGQRFNQFDPGVMAHEIGHALGLPDLYGATGFRDDVDYVDSWCHMGGDNSSFNHFCAWSKWAVNWIVDDPGDPNLNRVIEVPMPAPSGVTQTEAWLCPVEHWDDLMRADIVAAVGNGLPVGQMMKVALGSDGGVVDLIELRTAGAAYSQALPATPAILVTNVLQPGTDTRWAVNGLYRRSVHLLNDGHILTNVNDKFDFAAAPEFPVKGTTVQLMELRTIRGGSITIARVRVERQAAEFIDLYFQDNVPSWRSPDIWVDWAGDNADPNMAREYPEGSPIDQGETVRFPSSGTEKHFLVVRPHNAGNVHAEDVKIRWFICDPPGAGDGGRWVQRDTQTLPTLNAGTWLMAPFVWNVDPATNRHQCIRGEIIDWKIPTNVDPATGDTLALGSDDVILQNNNAQKNVSEFEAAT